MGYREMIGPRVPFLAPRNLAYRNILVMKLYINKNVHTYMYVKPILRNRTIMLHTILLQIKLHRCFGFCQAMTIPEMGRK